MANGNGIEHRVNIVALAGKIEAQSETISDLKTAVQRLVDKLEEQERRAAAACKDCTTWPRLSTLETKVAALETKAVQRASTPREVTSRDWRVKIMWGLGLFAAGAIGTPILGALGKAIAERLIGP